jgi:hypothetical protein
MSNHDFTRNPEYVFESEYWGKPMPPEDTGRYHSILSGGPACERLGTMAMDIIQGTLTGPEAVEGSVYNPRDPIIASRSPFSFPGAVLLGDFEMTIPRSQVHTDVPDELENPMDLEASARHLLRKRIEVLPSGRVAMPRANVSFTNGNDVYSRRVYLLANETYRRRGIRTMKAIDVMQFPDGTAKPEVMSSNEVNGHTRVGQTYLAPDRRTGEPRYFRIRSLELCAAGMPATFKERKSIFSFALRPVHG